MGKERDAVILDLGENRKPQVYFLSELVRVCVRDLEFQFVFRKERVNKT